MRGFWIGDAFAFASVHPVRTDIGDAVLHPFGLDIWIPGLEAVSNIGCRRGGGHVGSAIELCEGSVPMSIRSGELGREIIAAQHLVPVYQAWWLP